MRSGWSAGPHRCVYNDRVHGLSITLFGSPQIKRGDEQIHIQRRKDLALLIYLVSSGRAQSRETLATLFWEDYTQIGARSNLRKSLSRLKSMLGEGSIITIQEQVRLNPELPIDLDVTRFQLQIQQFKKHGHIRRDFVPYICEECQNALQAAVSLYTADFLQPFSLPDSPGFEEWQFFQAEGLRQSLAEALEHLVHHFIYTGAYLKGIEYGRKWLALDRFHEAAHKQLMILYALSGQSAAAFRQFEECARILEEELGAQPDSDTLRAYEAIRRNKLHEIIQANTPVKNDENEEKPAGSPPRLIHNLPAHPTPFVARETELKETARLLKEPFCRLLTLLGPGGSGKTRLALQLATSIADDVGERFKDGIWFVSLAPRTDPHSIAGAISEVLQISGFVKGSDAHASLLSYLRGRHMLLVLDNFEHLVSTESIGLVSDILETAPHGQVLVTSRERLNIQGEYIFQVEGLAIPSEAASPSSSDADPEFHLSGALQLFEQCARRVQPSFKIGRENAHSIARICRTVQGMPLAIELAAAWVQVLSPEEIGDEIERSLDFLESSWRSLPERQRSLRAVFDSSWDLLDRQSRPILKALSVFRTSFTRPAAQAIAGASTKSLLELANKSWIQKTSSGRYQIHELLRQYTFEKLENEAASFDQVQKQFCEYYADLSFSLWGMLKGSDPARAFGEAESEFENLRAAWSMLISRNSVDTAVDRILPVLFHYCETRGRVPELMKLIEAGLHAIEAREGQSHRETEVILRTVQGAFYVDGYSVRLSVNEAIFPSNVETIRRAWTLAHSEIELPDLGLWGIVLAFLYGRLVDFEMGLARLEQLLQHFQRRDAPWELAGVYLHIVRLLLCKRDEPLRSQDRLVRYLSRAMELFSSSGDRINTAHTLTQWGELKFYQQKLEEAIQQWEAARSTLSSIGEWAMATEMLWNISELYLQLGSFQKAFDGFREIANAYLEHGMIQQTIGALSKESFEKARYGDVSEALTIRQRCLVLVEEAGLEYQFGWNYWEMGEIMRIAGNLAEAGAWFERSRQVFEKFDDRVGSSFYYRGIADIAFARKEYSVAQENFTKSAELARIVKHNWVLIYALSGLGKTQLARQHLEPARQEFQEALELSNRVRDRGIALVVLAGVAEFLARLEKSQAAVEIGSLVESHFASWRETRNHMSALLSALRKSMTATDYRRAEERGRLLDLWETVGRLIHDLQQGKKEARRTPHSKGSRRPAPAD
ncbi:MAG TPA: tetratricopeptide repeat protein [Anaerolineales bacterium]|nr:tetratricopeptide repeat protein [Anaerolineales bacterium]